MKMLDSQLRPTGCGRGQKFEPCRYTLHSLGGEMRCVIDVDPKAPFRRVAAEREAHRIMRNNPIYFPTID